MLEVLFQPTSYIEWTDTTTTNLSIVWQFARKQIDVFIVVTNLNLHPASKVVSEKISCNWVKHINLVWAEGNGLFVKIVPIYIDEMNVVVMHLGHYNCDIMLCKKTDRAKWN